MKSGFLSVKFPFYFIFCIITLFYSCDSAPEKPSYSDAKEQAEYNLKDTESKISIIASAGGISGETLKALLTEYYIKTYMIASDTVANNDAILMSLSTRFKIPKKQVATLIFRYENYTKDDSEDDDDTYQDDQYPG